RLPSCRAPWHSARHGALSRRVLGGDCATDQTVTIRTIGVSVTSLSSHPADRRNLHAGSHEQRSVRAGSRSRSVADRGWVLRCRSRGGTTSVCRSPESDQTRIDVRKAYLPRRVLQFQSSADGVEARTASASSALVRRHEACIRLL